MQLKPFALQARYSLLEQELFDAMPQDGSRITTRDLVYARLKKGPWDVSYPRNIVATVMQKLIEKVSTNKEPFVIRRARQAGPNRPEMAYWLELKKPVVKERNRPQAVSSVFD